LVTLYISLGRTLVFYVVFQSHEVSSFESIPQNNPQDCYYIQSSFTNTINTFKVTKMVNNYLSYGVLGIGSIATGLGVLALLKPEFLLSNVFHFPVSSEPRVRKFTRTLVRIMGIRQLAVGYICLLLWSQHNTKLTGYALFGGLGIVIFDGFASRAQIGGGEWNHWIMVPLFAGVSGGLLGWY
jgi:hypothetical protein